MIFISKMLVVHLVYKHICSLCGGCALWREHNTAFIALANSGNDVPPATITMPIAKSETFNLLPKLTDPRIIISAPKIKIDKPTNKKIKFTIM